MKVYFDKEGLIESHEFYDDKELPYSLFSSISFVYPFVKFENELAEINDYCLYILCRLEDKLKELINESGAPFELIKGYQREKHDMEEDAESFFSGEYIFSPVFIWEKLSCDINKCTLLLLLLSYLESSLNEIAKWFCEERSISLGRKTAGNNEITFYIDKIGQCCCCNLVEILKNELAYLDKVRKIRNQFVHREWNQVERHYDKFCLCDVFNTVSMIFTEIEKAACNIGIIEENSLFREVLWKN